MFSKTPLLTIVFPLVLTAFSYATVTVTVSTPHEGDTVSAPINVQACATSDVAPIDAWHIYVNSVDNGPYFGDCINVNVPAGQGANTLVIRAWDQSPVESFGDQTVDVTVSGGGGGVPPSNHVFVVMFENTNFSSVYGNGNLPTFNSLANTWSLGTQYYANFHPSIGNYFELTAGEHVTDNDDGYTGPMTDDNIVRELTAAGKSWKEYSEGLPYVGYTGGDICPQTSCQYVRHHNPMTYFSDVLNSSSQQQNLVPFSQLQNDITSGALPNYGFIVPNNCDNGHDDSICPMSSFADPWLQNNIVNTLLQSGPFQPGGDGILFIVFDESGDDNTNGGGLVYMAVIGPQVKRGYQSGTFYQHQSLLRTVTNALGISAPNDAAGAQPMADFFQ